MPCTSPCIRKKSGSALENTTTCAPSSRLQLVEQRHERADERAVDQVARRVVDHDLGDAGRHLAAQHIVGHGSVYQDVPCTRHWFDRAARMSAHEPDRRGRGQGATANERAASRSCSNAHRPATSYGCGAGPARDDVRRHGGRTSRRLHPGHHRAAPGPHALAALLASRVSLRLFRIAALVSLVSFIAAIGSVIDRQRRTNPNGVFFLLNVLLVATVPVVIARALWKREGRRRPHRAGRDLHLRAARDAVRVRVRRHRRDVERSVLRADRARHRSRLPVLQLHHPDHRRLRRLHRVRRSRARARGARGAWAASCTW